MFAGTLTAGWAMGSVSESYSYVCAIAKWLLSSRGLSNRHWLIDWHDSIWHLSKRVLDLTHLRPISILNAGEPWSVVAFYIYFNDSKSNGIYRSVTQCERHRRLSKCYSCPVLWSELQRLASLVWTNLFYQCESHQMFMLLPNSLQFQTVANLPKVF